jgi:hypothetical protein
MSAPADSAPAPASSPDCPGPAGGERDRHISDDDV